MVVVDRNLMNPVEQIIGTPEITGLFQIGHDHHRLGVVGSWLLRQTRNHSVAEAVIIELAAENTLFLIAGNINVSLVESL